ncbi:MAG: uvrD1 [Magnetococcales bacterium]|nr:uvrD1 [Magnetococcales bacterium]
MDSRASKPDTQADIEIRKCLESEQSFLVVAGAGSGKTTSLIKALEYLGKKYGAKLRKNGQRIACITYTNVAVNEIFDDVGRDDLFHVSTIHSFLWELAKPFQHEIRSWVKQHIEKKVTKAEEHNKKPRTRSATITKNNELIKHYNDIIIALTNIKSFQYAGSESYRDGVLGHADIIKMVPELLSDKELLRKIVAGKFPFIFVDESQDSDRDFILALNQIYQGKYSPFCLGFFGDPMQQIYATGIGSITKMDNWKSITKKENFRCSKEVLCVINNIRKDGDGIQQTDGIAASSSSGSGAMPGSARIFILPMDNNRSENIIQVRNWIANAENDPLWRDDTPKADLKILIIVHRMAADHLGFLDIFHAIHDQGSRNFKAGFNGGTLWLVKPFLQTLMPLVEAVSQNNQYRVIKLLREAKSDLLSQKILIQEPNPASYLSSIKSLVETLANMMPPNSGNNAITVKECLQQVYKSKLVPMESRMENIANGNLTAAIFDDDDDDDEERNIAAIESFLKCPISQMWNYRRYLDGESPFSTQHGVKGAQFNRVLVVLDDENGEYNLYSYSKYFGLADPSKTDLKNKNENKETSIDRTRRLFYVCCSRAKKDLAVVLFAQDVETARQAVISTGIFSSSSIIAYMDKSWINGFLVPDHDRL